MNEILNLFIKLRASRSAVTLVLEQVLNRMRVAGVYLESSRSLQHAAGVDLVHVLVSAGSSESANQLSKMRITVNFHNSFTFNF